MDETNDRIASVIAKCSAGEASPEEMEMLVSWLGENREHALEFARMTDLDYAADPPFSPEDINTDKALKRTMLAIRKDERKSHRTKILKIFEHVAAALFIPLVLLTVYFVADRPETDEAIAWQTVTTPFRTNTRLELPDGSQVWLNGGSTLRYPLAFTKGERTVSLTGEAYFEVESDKKNPFTVNTGNVTVTATGTAFNVDAFRNDDMVSVTMVRGTVDVDMKGTTVRMNPGERICYSKRASTYTVDQADPEKWCAWRNGRIIFENDRLEYVFHRLGQLYNVEFTVCSPEINRYVYHAVFTDETLPEILDMLRISAPIRYEILQSDSPDPNSPKQQIRVYAN